MNNILHREILQLSNMFRNISKIVLLFLALLNSTSALMDSYAVLAPHLVRPGSNYSFTLTLYGYGGAEYSVSARIENSQGLPLVQDTFENNLAVPDTINSFDLKVPAKVPQADYQFVIQVDGAVSFRRSHAVSINQKSHSIFIQTDKFLYKPGQTVLFRAVGVKQDLKPYTKPLNLTIYDQFDNKIYEVLNQRNSSGLISGELKLSETTTLGEWRIRVTTQSSVEQRTFQVAEYTLPKYEVKVHLDSYFFLNENNPSLQKKLIVTVTAMYSFGKPVKGKAELTLKSNPPTSNTLNIVVQLTNGKADHTFTLADLHGIIPDITAGQISSPSIFVQANVSEFATGVSLLGSRIIPVYKSRYNIEFLKISPSNFKPGFTYFASLRLFQVDGTFPFQTDIRAPGTLLAFKFLTVIVTYSGVESEVDTSRTLHVPLTGSGYLTFEVPTFVRTSRIIIEPHFYDEVARQNATAAKTITPFNTRDRKFIQVTLLKRFPTVKPQSSLKLKVRTSDRIYTFQYQVLGKGGIILSDTFTLRTPFTESTFSIFITNNLALNLVPEARIIVFFITSTGELVADSLSVPVVDYFSNEVSLSFNASVASPGDRVQLKVKAYRNSLVCLLAVDQSVLLLNAGNDITQEMIENDLKKYGTSSDNDIPHGVFRGPIWSDGDNTDALLKISGVFIITNFFIENKKWIPPTIPPIAEPATPVPPGAKSEIFKANIQKMLGDRPIWNGNPPSGPTESPPPSPTPLLIPNITRKNFPETYIWTSVDVGNAGTAILNYELPDTITSWVATAFATSEEAGLGLSANFAKVTVVKPFFVSLNLPYSVVRGEQFALHVTVFNYFGQDLAVEVTVLQSDHFLVKQCTDDEPPKKIDISRNILVKNNDAASIYFWMIVTSLDQIPIEVRAASAAAGDSMKVNLLSKPEGQTQSYSSSSLIRIPPDETSTAVFSVSLPPPDVLVSDSVVVEATIVGDVLGTALNNLDKLLQMPAGCGEQNMLNFAPDVYILKYLESSNQLTEEIKTKATQFINKGYQTELTFQRIDGSFSAFGNNDAAGSIWLSAFVSKVLRQAKDYIPIDNEKIGLTLSWMMNLQNSDGSFSEPPGARVIHTDMQGGSSAGITLTAYVLISLIVNRNANSWAYKTSTSKATTYLEQNFESHAQSRYVLAITSYALYLASSPRLDDILKLLERVATLDGDLKYWHKEVEGSGSAFGQSWTLYTKPLSIDIEMTSYALLVFASQGDLTKSLPIAKWLIKQRNPQGGFRSTQDTVVGLEALSVFARMVAPSPFSSGLSVTVRQDATDEVFKFQTIRKENALLLQFYQIPSHATTVTFSATGEGLAIAQLNVKYNINSQTSNLFLEQVISSKTIQNKVILSVCLSWNGLGASGMVLTQVYLLTGYSFVSGYGAALKEQIGSSYKKDEFYGDRLAVYLEELLPLKVCFKLTMERQQTVQNPKPALVETFRYYDPNTVVTGFYSAVPMTTQTSCPPS